MDGFPCFFFLYILFENKPRTSHALRPGAAHFNLIANETPMFRILPPHHAQKPAFLPLAMLCLALLLFVTPQAKAAGRAVADFGALMSTCLQLLDSGHALGGAAPLSRLGFAPFASSNPYGGKYATGPSTRATAVLNIEAHGAGEQPQYTFRPALKGYVNSGAAGSGATWLISPVSHGSTGQGPGFFLLYPESGLSREELQQIWGSMQHSATTWNNAMIADNTWVYDCVHPGGNRLSCYYSMDGQGLYHPTFIFRRATPVARYPLRDRGPGPHKAGSSGGFLRGVGF